MFFRSKGKLKKEFDDKLVNLIKETKEDLQQAKIIEELMDDYDLGVIAQRKTAEVFISICLRKLEFVRY